MIDFHCHLDLYANAISLLPEVNHRNMFTLAVTTSPQAWTVTSKIFAKFQHIAVGIGFHPELITDRLNEMPLMLQTIKKEKYIGEIGIDGTVRNSSSIDIQLDAFRNIMHECGKNRTHVMSIHSRAAVSKVLDVLEKRNEYAFPILHWFTGTQSELHRAIDLGCWFSINPAMIKHSKGMKLVAQIPLERILPETDGPFTEIDGKSAMPWDAIRICEKLSVLHHKSKNEVETILCNNADMIVKL